MLDIDGIGDYGLPNFVNNLPNLGNMGINRRCSSRCERVSNMFD